jgi:hypothetical protein
MRGNPTTERSVTLLAKSTQQIIHPIILLQILQSLQSHLALSDEFYRIGMVAS